MEFQNEEGYLKLLRKILNKGVEKSDRTGIGTLSLFGEQLKFNLEDNTLPILTTKKVFIKAVIHELLWFLRGQTDSKILENEGVNIWKGNTTREFLDNRGLTQYEIGDTGPLYSHQLRHFNAEYTGCSADYSGKGIDQVQNIINEIRENPDSRRLLMTTFNPSAVDKSVLWPCHGIAIQFYVNDGFLSCMMTQRSVDSACGLPYNITSYSILTHLIANVCGLKPKELIMCLGDVHLYKPHLENVRIQIERIPKQFPKLNIKRNIQFVNDVVFDDFEIVRYEHHGPLNFKMAI